jgi:hypothetical protein
MALEEIEEIDPSGPNSVLGELVDSCSRFHADHPWGGATVLTSVRRKADQIVDVPLVSIVCHRTNVCETDRLGQRGTRAGCQCAP